MNLAACRSGESSQGLESPEQSRHLRGEARQVLALLTDWGYNTADIPLSLEGEIIHG